MLDNLGQLTSDYILRRSEGIIYIHARTRTHAHVCVYDKCIFCGSLIENYAIVRGKSRAYLLALDEFTYHASSLYRRTHAYLSIYVYRIMQTYREATRNIIAGETEISTCRQWNQATRIVD
jgi:hypothetical protein